MVKAAGREHPFVNRRMYREEQISRCVENCFENGVMMSSFSKIMRVRDSDENDYQVAGRVERRGRHI